MEAIKVKDVSKFDRHGKVLLDKVNLEIEGGTTLCLIGPHNSGKTSLLLSISGNTKIDKGEIYFGEKLINSPLRSLQRSRAKRIGDILTPHPYKQMLSLPFLKDRFFLNQVIPERLELLAKKIGINENELLGKVKRTYSKGERQKLELARYLLTQRNIFLLDDPLTGMDSLTRSKAKESLKELLKELKVTTILITYFTEEAFYLGNKVAIMRAGKIEQAGGREIVEHSANDFVRSYLKV